MKDTPSEVLDLTGSSDDDDNDDGNGAGFVIPSLACQQQQYREQQNQQYQTMTANNAILDGFLKDSAEFYNEYKSSNGTADHELYMNRLRLFLLHTFNAQMGYNAEICGVPEGSKCDKNGFFFHPDRETAHLKFAVAAGIDGEEAERIFRSVDNVHAYS